MAKMSARGARKLATWRVDDTVTTSDRDEWYTLYALRSDGAVLTSVRRVSTLYDGSKYRSGGGYAVSRLKMSDAAVAAGPQSMRDEFHRAMARRFPKGYAVDEQGKRLELPAPAPAAV